jgi:quercetin dioxygenase-like cupin family protein
MTLDPRSRLMTEVDTHPLVRRAGDGQTVSAPAGRLTFKARGEETGGAMTLFETVAPPGAGPPLHVHVDDDEFMYVLEGRLRFRLEEAIHEGPAGTFVFIPKGMTHTWQNAGDSDARFLAGFALAAPGMERFFERSAEFADDAPVTEVFKRFGGDAGMDVLGPPLRGGQ